jgi:membrane-associated protease RseP (regulator of RpoE activity)
MERDMIFASMLCRAHFLSLTLAMAATPAAAEEALFKPGVASSGWVDIILKPYMPIFVPIKINGQDAAAMLWGGPSMIDKDYAGSIGLNPSPDEPAPLTGLDVQVGDLTLHDMSVQAAGIATPAYAKIAGRPTNLALGIGVFQQLIVDIDFARHRVAFEDPKGWTKPAGAVEIPLLLKGDDNEKQWVVPLSVDSAPADWFEVELGNVIGPLMVTRSYAETNKLFDAHPTSERLSGRYHETVVSLDHLGFAGVDFAKPSIAIIPDTELPPEGVTGGVGLPLLARFHLVFDYPHNRLFATPNPDAGTTPIDRDRIGLTFTSRSTDFTVAFVAPKSPAAEAGFQAGDRMTLIDGKPFDAWALADLVALQLAAPGVKHSFTLADGTVREVTARDFF